MIDKKILVLLPDGIGLRNFAYTDFYKKAEQRGLEIIFWNNTPFDLSDAGFKEIKIVQSKNYPLTEIYKNARKQIELNLSKAKSQDDVYDSYRFSYSYKNAKSTFKSLLVQGIVLLNSYPSGLRKVRQRIMREERKTLYYHQCLETLRKENPAMVFCTNQRPMSAIAPILAAQELGIPTASFIFSWDNLPKATMVIETDYYFVWSDLMKKQLLSYYPYIKPHQIYTTGTPQFETHTDTSKIVARTEFLSRYNLDTDKKYICYSGDDVTTSPNDPMYLNDVAQAVRNLNSNGHQLGIIFRRCPVDFSSRFDSVLKQNADVITVVEPLWKKIGENWNTIMPTPEDLDLQMNTIAHTEFVINLGSSMVFDYASFNKPCVFINYDYTIENASRKNWSVAKTYRFVHFRSMSNKEAVIWLNDKASIEAVILKGLANEATTIGAAREWFEKINLHPVTSASDRIVDAIVEISESAQINR